MAQTGLADRLRAAFHELGVGGGEVAQQEVFRRLDLIRGREKATAARAVRDLVRTGELTRTRPGFYLWRARERSKPLLIEKMHGILRMRKTVSIEDLQELTGASRTYAKEFVEMMRRRGVVETLRRPGRQVVYHMIEDPGPELPARDEKATKLRRIREAKKAALAEIDALGKQAVDLAQRMVRLRLSVADIPEEVADDQG